MIFNLNFKRWTLSFLVLPLCLLTTCSLNPVAEKSIASSDVFKSISINSANAVFHEGRIPAGRISDAPSISTKTQVRKGEVLVLEITVPENAQQLYFSASTIKATYLTLAFGDENDDVDGYFTLDINPALAKKLKSTLLLNRASGTIMQTYTVKIGTNQNTYMNSFDINIAYKSPAGVSRTVKVPISINALLPIHNQLRVGFRPPETDGFSLCIERPDGSQVCYSNGFLSTGGCGECKVSYDDMMDVYWIDLPPDFGTYTVTAEMSIVCTQNQVLTLLLIINNAGKLEYYDGDFDVIGSGDDPTCIGMFSVGFVYHGVDSYVSVDLIGYEPSNFPMPNPNYPNILSEDLFQVSEKEEVTKGVGVRICPDCIAGYSTAKCSIRIIDTEYGKTNEYYLNPINTDGLFEGCRNRDFTTAVLFDNEPISLNFTFDDDGIATFSFWVRYKRKTSNNILVVLEARNPSGIVIADSIKFKPIPMSIASLRVIETSASEPGHVWITTKTANGIVKSYGFWPEGAGSILDLFSDGPGEVLFADGLYDYPNIIDHWDHSHDFYVYESLLPAFLYYADEIQKSNQIWNMSYNCASFATTSLQFLGVDIPVIDCPSRIPGCDGVYDWLLEMETQ